MSKDDYVMHMLDSTWSNKRHPAIPLPDRQKGSCRWCNGELTGRRKSWCSSDCREAYYRARGFLYRSDGLAKNKAKFGGEVICDKCGKHLSEYTDDPDTRAEVDHILAWALGGTHDPSNLQVLCHQCHALKTGIDIRKIVHVRGMTSLGCIVYANGKKRDAFQTRIDMRRWEPKKPPKESAIQRVMRERNKPGGG